LARKPSSNALLNSWGNTTHTIFSSPDAPKVSLQLNSRLVPLNLRNSLNATGFQLVPNNPNTSFIHQATSLTALRSLNITLIWVAIHVFREAPLTVPQIWECFPEEFILHHAAYWQTTASHSRATTTYWWAQPFEVTAHTLPQTS
jgi:hypothetical protein